MRLITCVFLGYSAIVAGCGQKRNQGNVDTAFEAGLVASEALLVATVDQAAYPWQATVVEIPLMESPGGEPRKILTGESGDPALIRTGSEILLFNRTADSKNFRRVVRGDQGLFRPESQKSFAGGEIGDPHDALDLGDGKILLAQYTQGALVVMDKESGAERERLIVDWDLPEGVSLKPEALIARGVGGKRKIYVFHQALSLEGGLISANGTQQVFVLEQDGKDLKPLDLDPAQAKVQGLKIKGSFPVPARFQRRDRILVISMCSRYVAAGSGLLGKTCESAVEEIDPDTNGVTVLWDLNESDFYMNGPVLPGPTASSFFANVEIKNTDNSYAKIVGRFDVEKQSVERLYTFGAESGGFWASFFDEAKKFLYVGDTRPEGGGQLTVVPDGPEGSRRVISLDGAPYGGVFVPR